MIRIVKSERDFAQNGATGIVIHTGTRYFAAVLLQEYYEFWRYAFWFWLVPPLVGAIAAFAIGLPFALIGLAVMMLVGLKVLPFNLHERELMGQAIEIAAIKLFYGRSDMAGEYRLQARSLIRSDSPYKLKGYWPDIPAINPVSYTNEMAIAGVAEPSIDAMLIRLGEKAPAAEDYVRRHWSKLEKWRPIGAEDKGY
jgi:hypothetical protein